VEQQMTVRAAVRLVAALTPLERESDVLEDEGPLHLTVATEARPLLVVAKHRVLGGAVRLVAVDTRDHAFGHLVVLGEREGRTPGRMAPVAERHRRLLVAPRRAAHRLRKRLACPYHEAPAAPVRIVAVDTGHVGTRVFSAGESVQGRFVTVAAETRRCALGRRLGRSEGLQVSRFAAAAVDVGLSRAVTRLAAALVG